MSTGQITGCRVAKFIRRQEHLSEADQYYQRILSTGSLVRAEE